jgi:hypothetical protein
MPPRSKSAKRHARRIKTSGPKAAATPRLEPAQLNIPFGDFITSLQGTPALYVAQPAVPLTSLFINQISTSYSISSYSMTAGMMNLQVFIREIEVNLILDNTAITIAVDPVTAGPVTWPTRVIAFLDQQPLAGAPVLWDDTNWPNSLLQFPSPVSAPLLNTRGTSLMRYVVLHDSIHQMPSILGQQTLKFTLKINRVMQFVPSATAGQPTQTNFGVFLHVFNDGGTALTSSRAAGQFRCTFNAIG